MATGGSTDFLSDETFDLLCSVCKLHGKNCEVEKYCVECKNYYCLVCVKVHEEVALLSRHKILDKGQFKTSKGLSASQQGPGQTLPAELTERCDKHNHYYIDMYCQNHDDVGCATCIATNHRLCKNIFYIPEFLQNNATIPTYKETAQILEGVAQILTNRHSDLQHEKQFLLKAKADTLENIRKFRKEIDERLDKLEQNSINETESLYKAFIDEIEKATKEIQCRIKSAQNKLASPGNNASQFFVNAKTGNKTAEMASKWIEENKTQIPVVDIDFQADQRLSKFLEETNTLGNLIQRNMMDVGNMASSARKPQDQQVTSRQSTRQKKIPATSGSNQQKTVLLQGHRQKKYTVKLDSDKSKCNIVSACTLKDGTIILSDKNNKKLKHLGRSTYTVTDYCDLPGAPWQVCAISKQEVAVCLPWQQIVQFISVGSRMTKTREINTDFECYGLAYANDTLYISDSETSVYIYSITGSKLRQFSLDQSGQRLFSNIRSLVVSEDGSRIYVADCLKGLIALNNNGQVVGRFNGAQLKTASHCYLTETRSLLVCGFNSHNVLQLNGDGELIGEVVKSDDNKEYMAVCCNKKMSRLIAGSGSEMSRLIVGSGSDEIEVYYLSKCNSKS